MIRSRAWLPIPLLSALLLVVWLLLQQSIGLGQWLLGGFLAIVIPLLTRSFWERQPDLKRPWLLIRYCLRVLGDIVVANLQVSMIILNPRKDIRPAFIEYPLELEENFPIVILTGTITLTPGTVSARLRQDGRTLVIHSLNNEDPQTLIDGIRERYERPLKEIFDC